MNCSLVALLGLGLGLLGVAFRACLAAAIGLGLGLGLASAACLWRGWIWSGRPVQAGSSQSVPGRWVQLADSVTLVA